MYSQSIDIPGLANARELGGYVIGGKCVKNGVFLRTAALFGAPSEALEALRDRFSLKTVIDFRMSSESDARPDPEILGVTNLHLPIAEIEDIAEDMGAELPDQGFDPNMDRMEMFQLSYESGMMDSSLYEKFLLSERGMRGWRAFFTELLSLEEGRSVLWHCTDGKDRTGCAAMLLLYALGADRETVLRDYLLTNEYNAEKLTAVRRQIEPLGWPKEKAETLLFMVGGVFEEYMNNGIDALESRYGSVLGYLTEGLGIGQEEIEELRRKFLV